MRVIGGKYRGKKLLPPRGGQVRPTADRVKEALFNILQAEVPESSVLDLFAGSGAIGIEALSRGAARVVLADADIECAKRNLALVGARCEVYGGDYRQTLTRLAAAGERFDLVFIDPPYRAGLAQDAGESAMQGVLAGGGQIVIEHPRGEAPALFGRPPFDTRAYGKVAISRYRKEEQA